MDNSQRNALIVLLLFALVVVSVLCWGLLKHDQRPAGKDDRERASQFEPPPRLAKAGSALRSLGPKLKLDRHDFVVNPADRRPLVVSIPAARSDEREFRKGLFRLRQGQRGNIVYRDKSPDSPSDLKTQTVNFPAGADDSARQRDDPWSGSIIAMKDGGSLLINCAERTRCDFSLE
ncbi:MAG: hypothetical protein ABI831_08615 [Betaproteobacteria bacterium]